MDDMLVSHFHHILQIRPLGQGLWLFSVVCNFNVDIGNSQLFDLPIFGLALLLLLQQADLRCLGPEIEYIYPPDISLAQSDTSIICFSSFPERHDADISEDMYFNFNLLNNSPDVALSSPSIPYGSLQLFHGTAVFRQEFDATTKRKFNQKSLVIISTHDYPVFFMTLLRIITQNSQLGDVARLEAACAQVSGWPSPQIGSQELSFLGDMISLDMWVFCVPHSAIVARLKRNRPLFPSFPLSGAPAPSSANTTLIHSMSATDPTEGWQSLISYLPSSHVLYILYECLILGESIIILGQTPRQVSAICTALLDLIRPIPYSGSIRPYIPMQSTARGADARLFDPASKDSFIAGITNPFLLQRYSNTAAASIPYILALSTPPSSSSRRSPSPGSTGSKLPSLKPSRSLRRRSSVSSPSSSTKRINVPGTPIKSQLRPEHFIKPDKNFMHTLEDSHPEERTTAVCNIRRHFTDMTARILAPVRRFMATTTTTTTTATANSGVHKPLPPLPGSLTEELPQQKFPVSEFLIYLRKQDTAGGFVGQTSHGRHKSREAFYSKLCSSDNFRRWLEVSKHMQQQMDAGLFN